MKILLVCGKVSLISFIKGFFKEEDEVHRFFDSERALKWLSIEKPDLAILAIVDLQMLKGQGIIFLSEAKKRHPKIKIIRMSKYASHWKQSIKIGCDGFLKHTFSKKELRVEIKMF